MRLRRSLYGVGIGLALAGGQALADGPVMQTTGHPVWSGPNCPPPPFCPTPAPGGPGAAVTPPSLEAVSPTPESDISTGREERGTQAVATAVPNMIGDSPGSACGTANFEGRIAAMINHPTFSCSRSKIAEDNSPLPRDRVYFNYQYFQNLTNLSATETDTNTTVSHKLSVHRYTFGMEKTFLDGVASVELRVPLNTQLTNNLEVNSDIPSISNNYTTDIGNIAVALKALFYDADRLHFSGGLLIHTPTAPDVNVHDVENNFATGGINTINNRFHYRNEATILSPFIAFLWEPDTRWFAQGFIQVDVDASGNSLDVDPVLNGVAQPRQTFHIDEQTLLRTDLGIGYWLYRSSCGSGITGIAPTVEVHYTTTLDNAELAAFQRAPVGNNVVILGNVANRLDIVNLVLGTTFGVGERATLAVGGVIPLSTGDNRAFDWELNLQLNWRF